MSAGLDIRYFAHSWVSDWNHGNAHFLRGLARELGTLGHKVRCYEALGSWSLTNLIRNEGERAIDAIDDFKKSYPDLDIQFYKPEGDTARFHLHMTHTQILDLTRIERSHTATHILGQKDTLTYTHLLTTHTHTHTIHTHG